MVSLCVGRDLLDLLRQQHLDRREERHPHAEVGREEQRRSSSRRTGTVGSASAAGSDAGVGSTVVTALARAAIWSRYQGNDDFGVRRWVSKSTCTSPKRLVNPSAHSKLSSSDQTK